MGWSRFSRSPVKTYFKLHTSTASGKGEPGASQRVTVELERDTLLPFGSDITFPEFATDGDVVALNEEVAAAALELAPVLVVFPVTVVVPVPLG